MKRNVLLLGLVSVLVAVATAQRLPEIATPENYKLAFTPDFEKDNFSGEETIQIRVLKPTAEIVLNAAEIDFHEVSITSAGTTQQAAVKQDREEVRLAVAKPLPAGPASIHIRYTGILNNQLRGLYLGKLADGKKYAVTQFEATDARRAFPSFDEPAFKATFDISVIADNGLIAISNTPIVSDTPGPVEGKHTVRFATTPKMSSYLAAIAVGNFDYIEGAADGVPIRIYTPPGKKQLATFALATTEQCIKYFDHYFYTKYPFRKLDLIALPDFSAGAMENTAAITFREIDLLLDEGQASVEDKKSVAETISHEIAHQWFGDMVTMQWWDDIWLNEGFATWMQSKPIAAWKPEWNVPLDDVLDSSRSMDVDSLLNTRPIHQAAETPDQINELFDGIAYGKTAAVLRMLEAYLGPEVFRRGVNQYLQQHAYGNATTSDFWKALAAVSNKPVDRVMATFVNQAGVPIVSLQTQCSGGNTRATLTQRRYFDSRQLFDAENSELWMVPVCLKSMPEGAAGSQQQCELLTAKQQSFALPGCGPWVMANAGATGFYHSGYDSNAIRAMARNPEKDLTPGERVRLVSDEWAATRIGCQTIGDFMALADGFSQEHSRAVMQQLTQELEYANDHFVTDADRGDYQLWVRQLLTPLAKQLGWQPVAGEPEEYGDLRSIVMHTIGYAGADPDALARARQLTERALENPSSIDPTLAGTAFSLAALNGDSALYDKIMAHTRMAHSPEEFYLYQSTLTEFRDTALLKRTLDYAISPAVRSQDMVSLIANVMDNPAGEQVAWEFARAHWQQIADSFGGFGGGAIVGATAAFCDAKLEGEVKDFFTSHQVPAAERSLRQALEHIDYCVDLKEQQSVQLANWLEHRGASSGQ